MLNIVSMIGGILIKVYDDITDNKEVFQYLYSYRIILQIILVFIYVYLVYYDSKIGIAIVLIAVTDLMIYISKYIYPDNIINYGCDHIYYQIVEVMLIYIYMISKHKLFMNPIDYLSFLFIWIVIIFEMTSLSKPDDKDIKENQIYLEVSNRKLMVRMLILIAGVLMYSIIVYYDTLLNYLPIWYLTMNYFMTSVFFILYLKYKYLVPNDSNELTVIDKLNYMFAI